MANLFRQEPVGGAGPALLVDGGQGPVLLFNDDLLHTVWLCDDPRDLQPGDTTTSVPLLPLTSLGFDGDGDVWGQCVPGQAAQVSIIPGGTTGTASPAQIAAQIAATGVSLYASTGNLINDASHVIPAASTVTLPAVAISQIGYEISLPKVLESNAGAANPIITYDLKWTQSQTGQLVSHETWTLVAGSTSPGSVYYGTGPTKGDTLTISITNNDTLNSITVTTVLNQNSRVYQTDDWRQEAFGSVPSFTAPLHDQQGNLLAAGSFSIGAGLATSRLVPLYAGKVTIRASSDSGKTGTVQLFNLDQAVFPSGNVAQFYQAILLVSGTSVMGNPAMPRSVCEVQLTNTDVAAGNFSFAITADGYRQ